MKRLSYKLLLVGLMLMGPYVANAQFLKGLGERIKRKVESRTEQKVDEKTDQALDSIFVSGKKNNEQEEESTASPSSKSTTNVSKEYRFGFEATIEVTNYDKKKPQTNTIIQSYGDGSLLSTVEQATMIHDFEEEVVFMIDTVKSEAQSISLSWFMRKMDNQSVDSDKGSATVTKTGRTETINGYVCHEYLIEHDDGKVEAWQAPDVDFDYSDYLKGFSKAMSKKSKVPTTNYGYVMKMISFNKKAEKITEMEVVDLVDKSRTISMSNFQVTKLL